MYKSIRIPQIRPQEVKSLVLDKFIGVDFTKGDYIQDPRRSPDALNTIWGNNPNVFDTRTGLKRVYQDVLKNPSTNEVKPLYGVHIYEIDSTILVHAGTELFALSGDLDTFKKGECVVSDAIYEDLAEQSTTSFMMNGKLYILGGGVYLEYNGVTATAVTEKAFVPTTVINRLPSGGGTPLEAVNILSAQRINSFRANSIPQEIVDTFTADGTIVDFNLSTTTNITYDEIIVKVEDVIKQQNIDYVIDRVNAKVTFFEAPTNLDEIEITYYAEDIDNLVWEASYYLDSQNIDSVDTVVVNGEEMEEGEVEHAETFEGDGTTTIFNLSRQTNISDIVITVDGVAETSFSHESGVITFDTAPSDEAVISITYNTTDYSLDKDTGVITFTTAPQAVIGGVDNVIITFSKEIEGYADQINKCTIYGIFGGENDTRVFLSGNDDTINREWSSGLDDPTYFPDNGFYNRGADSTGIMGYVKQYDTQMIIKEGNQQDGSGFLKTFQIDSEGNPLFPTAQGSVGIGAISKRAFAYLQGEPLFLSNQGVIGIQGSNVDNQRLMRDKSEMINSVLVNENNLDQAIGVEFENRYYLFINGKVFVADYRMRYEDAFGNIQYEWMYWNNIFAQSVKTYTYGKENFLLIGFNGMLFRLKKPTERAAFIDEDSNGNLSNIESYWTTPKLYFNSISVKKRLSDMYILFSQRNRIRVKVEAIVDGNRTVDLGTYEKAGLLNFDDLNFADFSFFSFHPAFTYQQRAMIERFDNIQFKISKAYPEEIVNLSFGVEIMQLTYQLLNN